MVGRAEGWDNSIECIRNIGWEVQEDSTGGKIFVNKNFRMIATDAGDGGWRLGIYDRDGVIMDFGTNDLGWTQNLVCAYGILWGIGLKSTT